MAHKKAGGSTRNGRDSNPKYLGVKHFGGEQVAPGNIIVRQRGTHWHAGSGVGIGNDHTLYALYSMRIGTNACEKAPSANSRLKKLGILKAIINASKAGLAPNTMASSMSRKKPSTREIIVMLATMPVD